MILTEAQKEMKQLWHNGSTERISYSRESEDWRNIHDAQIEEDYSDSIWMYLNSDVNSENVNNWEIDMRLKKGSEYSEN